MAIGNSLPILCAAIFCTQFLPSCGQLADQGGDSCTVEERQKWSEYLSIQRVGELSNNDNIYKQGRECRDTIYDLTRLKHGPPTHYEKVSKHMLPTKMLVPPAKADHPSYNIPTQFVAICGANSPCKKWDNLIRQGVGRTKCKYTDFELEEATLDEHTPAFWMCKLLFHCFRIPNLSPGVRQPDTRTPWERQREDFCNGCGTGQDEIELFYDELDCGAAQRARLSWPLLVLVVIVSTTFFALG